MRLADSAIECVIYYDGFMFAIFASIDLEYKGHLLKMIAAGCPAAEAAHAVRRAVTVPAIHAASSGLAEYGQFMNCPYAELGASIGARL